MRVTKNYMNDFFKGCRYIRRSLKGRKVYLFGITIILYNLFAHFNIKYVLWGVFIIIMRNLYTKIFT